MEIVIGAMGVVAALLLIYLVVLLLKGDKQ